MKLGYKILLIIPVLLLAYLGLSFYRDNIQENPVAIKGTTYNQTTPLYSVKTPVATSTPQPVKQQTTVIYKTPQPTKNTSALKNLPVYPPSHYYPSTTPPITTFIPMPTGHRQCSYGALGNEIDGTCKWVY